MPTLYVTEPGARIEQEYGQILVTKQDEVLARAPLGRVDEVVLVGNVGATTPAILALLDRGVGLSFVGRNGQLRGRLAPPAPRNAPLRVAQYGRAEEGAFCLGVARAVVMGKLRNSRTMMRRLARRRQDVAEGLPEGLLEQVQRALTMAEGAGSLAELRGLEGSGARAYFAFVGRALRAEMPFLRRSRRPPADPVNALLSLGYTLLNGALMAACELAGLDPYVGFFHADKYGRPALALDLVEEFRAPVVDSLVLTLVNKRMVGPEDFEPGPQGGVYLKQHSSRVFFREFSDRLETTIQHPLAGRSLSYRKIFEVQARQMAKAIMGEAEGYEAFAWW